MSCDVITPAIIPSTLQKNLAQVVLSWHDNWIFDNKMVDNWSELQ